MLSLSLSNLEIQGADKLEITSDGDLAIHTPLGTCIQKKPKTYQENTMGLQSEVPSGFTLSSDNRITFNVPSYDKTKPLTIDPLIYSTFLGGSANDYGYSIAMDASGNAYVTGNTYSNDFPITVGAFEGNYDNNGDIFVTKLNSTGSGLVYSTFLGGTNNDYGNSIAVDSSGIVYVTGATYSPDFPTTFGAFNTTYNGSLDVFVTKLNSSGSEIIYSTLLGGTYDDSGQSIVADINGNAYVTGYAGPGFPTTQGVFDATYNRGYEAFVIKLDTSGSGLVFSTFLGGSGNEYGYSITVDSIGNIYVTGNTTSPDFPTTTGAFDRTYHGGNWDGDIFVTKLNPSGSQLVYSTFLGGSSNDYGYSITVDTRGNAYVTGKTYSTDFPTTAESFDVTSNGAGWYYGDAFVTKLNPSGSGLVYSTYLGGSDKDCGRSIAVDENGNAYVTGETISTDFPTTAGALNKNIIGYYDAFVTRLNASGSGLIYSSYLGGSNNDYGKSIVLDASGNAYVTGYTESFDFPITNGAFDTTSNGYSDVFVTKMSMTGSSPIAAFYGTLTTGYVPLTVNFYDNSTGGAASIWYWEFGDGQTQWSVQNPTHTYISTGRYTVKMFVSNPYGASSIVRESYIHVIPDNSKANVSNVEALPSYGGIKLYWQNPVRSDYAATLIVYRTDRYPVSPKDGTISYWYNGTFCNVPGTNGQKYYFGIFAHDKAFNFLPGVFVSSIPDSYANVQNVTESTPWSGAAFLSWLNPTVANTYDGTILIRRKDRWPVGPADGYESDLGRWFLYWYNGNQTGETGLNPDSTYYYGIYSNDANMNFGPGVIAAHKENAVIGNIQNLITKPEFNSVFFSWVNPTTSNYNATLVVRNPDHIPASPTDGTIACWNNGLGFTDMNLTEGKKYYYTLFPNTPGMVFAPGVSVSVIPGSYKNIEGIDANAGDGAIKLCWINPNRADYLSSLVTRRTDRMPLGPEDGMVYSYWNIGTTFTDTGLTNGQTYYYAFYAQDKNGGFSPGAGVSVIPTSLGASLVANNSSMIMDKSVLLVSSSIQSSYSGWNDNLGDFRIKSASQFWAGDQETYWQDSSLIIKPENTKLTMKNRMMGGSYKVKITYESDQEINLTSVFLEYKEEGSSEITSVINPAVNNTNKVDGKMVTESDLYGNDGASVQLQFLIQNPGKSVIRITSIQLVPITPIKVVATHKDQYAELM